jgi:hypothetical protein
MGKPISPGIAGDLVGNAISKGGRGTNVTQVIVRDGNGQTIYKGRGN